MIKLGVNIDHVATLRQARGGSEPNTLLAALEAVRGGADGITVHLREDRRHIQDSDVKEIKKSVHVPLNLEMALDEKIIRFALNVVPDKVCLVPEKRQELTTEGGLDATGKKRHLARAVPRLKEKGIEVSLFIDPVAKQIQTAASVGADAIEIHTGTYANAKGKKRVQRITTGIRKAVTLASKLEQWQLKSSIQIFFF